jgi:hypothetical protein
MQVLNRVSISFLHIFRLDYGCDFTCLNESRQAKKEPSSLRYGCAMGGQRADRSFEWFFYSIDLMFLFPLIDLMLYAITYFMPSFASRAITGEISRQANLPNNK